jgi:hypothetical protein
VLAILVACQPSKTSTSVFPLTDGWLGGDGASSVPLPAGHTLWFFDDTFVGDSDARTRSGVGEVHNTIAVASGSPLGGPWNVTYAWGADRAPFFAMPQPPATDGYLWVSDAAAINGAVVAAAYETISTPGENLGFAYLGMTLVSIANPAVEPTAWNIQYDALSSSTSCFPGAAMTLDASGENLLLYTDCNPAPGTWQKPIMLVRIPVTGLAAPAANAQYLATDGTWQPGLPATANAAAVVMPAGHTEFTVRYHPEVSQWVAVLVMPGPGLTNQIAMMTAPAPEGPWSDPVGVYTYPETVPGSDAYVDASVFCYAAKEHQELESPGVPELIVSYVCSSTTYSTVVDDLGLYIPRFIKLAIP